jgi:very-short-patch-repair endonuclease
LWREQRVVFEIDGYGAHRSRAKFNRDRRKDAVLKADGWDPNRLSNDQLESEPYAAVAYVAQALARGRAARNDVA